MHLKNSQYDKLRYYHSNDWIPYGRHSFNFTPSWDSVAWIQGFSHFGFSHLGFSHLGFSHLGLRDSATFDSVTGIWSLGIQSRCLPFLWPVHTLWLSNDTYRIIIDESKVRIQLVSSPTEGSRSFICDPRGVICTQLWYLYYRHPSQWSSWEDHNVFILADWFLHFLIYSNLIFCFYIFDPGPQRLGMSSCYHRPCDSVRAPYDASFVGDFEFYRHLVSVWEDFFFFFVTDGSEAK